MEVRGECSQMMMMAQSMPMANLTSTPTLTPTPTLPLSLGSGGVLADDGAVHANGDRPLRCEETVHGSKHEASNSTDEHSIFPMCCAVLTLNFPTLPPKNSTNVYHASLISQCSLVVVVVVVSLSPRLLDPLPAPPLDSLSAPLSTPENPEEPFFPCDIYLFIIGSLHTYIYIYIYIP